MSEWKPFTESEEFQRIDDEHYAQFGYYIDERRNRPPTWLVIVVATLWLIVTGAPLVFGWSAP